MFFKCSRSMAVYLMFFLTCLVFSYGQITVQYPLSNYKVWGYFFPQDLNKEVNDKRKTDGLPPIPPNYHLGEDVGYESDPVYPIAAGVVMYAQFKSEESRWGYLIVMEHRSELFLKFGYGTDVICSVHGHNASNLQVVAGQEISQSNLNKPISYVGAKGKDNGNWAPHDHVGVYLGPYGAKAGEYASWIKGYTSSWEETKGWVAASWLIKDFNQKYRDYADLPFSANFRPIFDSYLSGPFPNPSYHNGSSQSLVGKPDYDKRVQFQSNGYWSIKVPTDKGWNLYLTYQPGSSPQDDKPLAPYPVAVSPEITKAYWSRRDELGPPLADTILGRNDSKIELVCLLGRLTRFPDGSIETVCYLAPGLFYDQPYIRKETFWIARAYNYHFGELGLGSAVNLVHRYAGSEPMYIQDFSGGSAGNCALIANNFIDQAFLIGNEFWQYYLNHDDFRLQAGAPASPELADRQTLKLNGKTFYQERKQNFQYGLSLAWGYYQGKAKPQQVVLQGNQLLGGGVQGDSTPEPAINPSRSSLYDNAPIDSSLPGIYEVRAHGTNERYVNYQVKTEEGIDLEFLYNPKISLEPIKFVQVQVALDEHFERKIVDLLAEHYRHHQYRDYDGSGRDYFPGEKYIRARTIGDGPTVASWSPTLYIHLDWDSPNQPQFDSSRNPSISTKSPLVWELKLYTVYDLPEPGSSGLTNSEVQIAASPDFKPETIVFQTNSWSPAKQSVRLDNPQPGKTYYARIRLHDNAGNPAGLYAVSTAMTFPAPSAGLPAESSVPDQTTTVSANLFLTAAKEAGNRSYDPTLIWDFNFPEIELSSIWQIICQVSDKEDFSNLFFSPTYGKGKESLVFQALTTGMKHFARFKLQLGKNSFTDWSPSFYLYYIPPGQVDTIDPPAIVNTPALTESNQPSEVASTNPEPAEPVSLVNQPSPARELFLTAVQEFGHRSYDQTLIWRFNGVISEVEPHDWEIHCQVSSDGDFTNLLLDASYGRGKLSLVFTAREQNKNYYARFQVKNAQGYSDWSPSCYLFWQPSQAKPAPSRLVSQTIALGQNYPNPFNAETWIPLTCSQPLLEVKLLIFNSQGLLIRSLTLDFLNPGQHRLHWDGRDQQGQPVSSGVYFYQLLINHQATAIKKMAVGK